jgi:putative protease
MKKIELLAPARDAEYGRIAVDYGADAVYIGGPKFGARSAAGNPTEEIGRLADYAHRFGAKVYVALNTILYDNELSEAERIARRAWEAGADALIVQDMAYAQMDLLPIPLHASTQAFNFTPEKVRFFEQAGFSRVILERALSLEQIRTIRAETNIELEAFVHGAICVCHSGQCYLSQAVAGRSGNRGECMQPCRWDYNLTGAGFRKIAEKKHLLSVHDLNLSDHLEALIDAGVGSFKIEGRLKDATYLKNSVAWYRQRLDAILLRRGELARASEGETAFDFAPDPQKSFSRGFTDYYLVDPDNRVASFDTPKSTGQYIGEVLHVSKDSFTLNGDVPLVPGDGICFVSGGELLGTNVGRVEGHTVWPGRMEGLAPGAQIRRNHDQAFTKALEQSKTRRTIAVRMQLTVAPDRIVLRAEDGRGNAAERSVEGRFEPAREAAGAEETIRRQIAKTGETIFRVAETEIRWDTPRFVPVSALNALRRETLEELDALRLKNYTRPTRPAPTEPAPYPGKTLDYRANVTNRLAERFYRRHGVEAIEPGFELTEEHIGRELMRTRYCLRREMGRCLKDPACTDREPMRLENNFHTFALHFDCAKCEMALIYNGKRPPKTGDPER